MGISNIVSEPYRTRSLLTRAQVLLLMWEDEEEKEESRGGGGVKEGNEEWGKNNSRAGEGTKRHL